MSFVGNVALETSQGFMAVVGEGVYRGLLQERRRRPGEDVAFAAARFVDGWR
jgi:hypothetical protein